MPQTNRKYQTVRTTRYRRQNFIGVQKQTISHIETFGCQIVRVARDGIGPDFCYTVGAFDTCNNPEMIVVGLPTPTAKFLLNQAVIRQRNGVNLIGSRHRSLIGEVECEFRPVKSQWIEHLMGVANRYYEGSHFPVLQAIYPDRENRFPEDENFDKGFSQPLLQSDAPRTRSEIDLWADPEEFLSRWKFSEGPNEPVLLSASVCFDNEPITFAEHVKGGMGSWDFLGDTRLGDRMPVGICFGHVVSKDPTLEELADLPAGWMALREKVGVPWTRQERRPKKRQRNAISSF